MRFFMVMILALAALPADARVRFGNKLTLTPTFYGEDVGQGTSLRSGVIREEPTLGFRRRSVRFKLAPWLYADPLAKSTSENFIADMNEANLDWRAGDWTVKAGINAIAWGVTDVANPLDIASARRYLDPLNAEKRGVPSLDLNYERGAWRIELLYVPVQFESILPGDKSRWLPRDLTVNRTFENDVIKLGPNFKYGYVDRLEIDDALKNNFGARVDFQSSRVDWQGVFFEGAPTAPAIDTPVIELDATSGNVLYATHVSLQPVYSRRRTAGGGAVMTLESSIIRLAYAYSDRLSRYPGLPGWAHTAVAGLERNFSVGRSTLTALLQASHGQHEESADNTITSLDRIFDRSWMLGLRLSTSSDWTFTCAGLYDGARGGGYAQLKIERKLGDGVLLSTNVDWIDGPAESPLGTYRRNKRVSLGLATFF